MTSQQMALQDLRLLGGCCASISSTRSKTAPVTRPETQLPIPTSQDMPVDHRRHRVAPPLRLPPRMKAAHEAWRQALNCVPRCTLPRHCDEARSDPADLDHLRRAYADAMTAATLAAEGERFAWNWRPDEQRLDQLLWPVARSAVELLTAGDPRRIKVW